jgi:NADH dehydrogenase [ubiquinone] 1 alpha subcomplex assembly factor 7
VGRGTFLSEKIARRIRAEGPLSLAAYMAMALHDPEAGYYARRQPLGSAGDFTTAPEISQIFGELIGFWFADLWQRGGRPEPVSLVELGPGRGTLMVDLLRAAATVPEFHRALRLWLVEASPVLRDQQRQRLADAAPQFAAGLDEIPAGPLFLVANEFLDALPIRQLVRGADHWAERLVALDDEGGLVFATGPESPAAALLVPETLRDSPLGSVVEICPAAAALISAVAERLIEQPGAALFIDYGYFPSAPGPTLAAIREHRPVEPLDRPGSADLSAHVDFAAVAAAAGAASVKMYGPVPQGRLLAALGAGTRLETLLRAAPPEGREALVSGLHRLIDPGQMGTLFKAIAIVSPGLPVPAGFAGDW